MGRGWINCSRGFRDRSRWWDSEVFEIEGAGFYVLLGGGGEGSSVSFVCERRLFCVATGYGPGDFVLRFVMMSCWADVFFPVFSKGNGTEMICVHPCV